MFGLTSRITGSLWYTNTNQPVISPCFIYQPYSISSKRKKPSKDVFTWKLKVYFEYINNISFQFYPHINKNFLYTYHSNKGRDQCCIIMHRQCAISVQYYSNNVVRSFFVFLQYLQRNRWWISNLISLT